MRYIRACVYFCLLSIRCFNVVQPDEISFPVGQSNCKKGQNFQKFQNLKNFFQKITFLKLQIFKKLKNEKNEKKMSKFKLKLSKISVDFKIFIIIQNFNI